ncbi:MAG TPA: chemotaxis protein CheB [Candidatus Nanopelagicales bacterium]
MQPAAQPVVTTTPWAPQTVDVALSVVIVAAGTRQVRLAQLLTDRGLNVCGAARDPDEVQTLIADHRPRVILLDLASGAGGLEVVEQVMARCPLPIVLTGAAAQDPDEAIAGGAVDVIASTAEALGSAAYGDLLARQLLFASRVRVITHPRGRLRDRARGRTSGPGGPAADSVAAGHEPARRRSGTPATARSTDLLPVVAIGASTGGPPALAAVLAGLPADLPAAVLIVQHMAEGFVASLAAWLDATIAAPVSVAAHGERLRAGHVLLAPSGANLELGPGLRVRLTEPRPGQLHVPEVDITFHNVAQACGPNAIGVLLTGMGRDGAAGLLEMRQQGAVTIGQDEQSSAVWGMPGAARALDAVSIELALDDIAPRVAVSVRRILGADSP